MFKEIVAAAMILLAPMQAWTGPVLTPDMGVNMNGPSGVETWYDEPMDGFIQFLYDLGWEGYHYIREDGVHMWHNQDGDWVMIGSYLPKYPRGTYRDTSLGPGIVADTGYFAYGEDQLDIATTWRSYL